MVLSIFGFPDLELYHKILFGLSTMVGGLGFGWNLVLTLCDARFQFPKSREAKALGFFSSHSDFYRPTGASGVTRWKFLVFLRVKCLCSTTNFYYETNLIVFGVL